MRSGSACPYQVSLCIRLSGSDRDFPAFTGRSGTQRARRPLRFELAVGAAGRLVVVPASSVCWRSCLLATVRGRCCTPVLCAALAARVVVVRIGSGWTDVLIPSGRRKPLVMRGHGLDGEAPLRRV